MNANAAANLVLGELHEENPNLKISPEILVVIISIIKALLPVLIDQCPTAAADLAKVCEDCLKPKTFWDWFRIVRARRILITEIGRHTLNELGGVETVLTATWRAGTKLTGEDADTLCHSVA